MLNFKPILETVGYAVDCAGVLVIVVGLLLATACFLVPALRNFMQPTTGEQDAYRTYRQNLGRAILLGLEFLVAGDIIRTVAVEPTLTNVYILGLIVLIRTFLSLSLQLELDGRLPWQRAK